MDLDEFKKKYSNIADALVREGYSKGYAAGRDFSKKERETRDKSSFESQVADYVSKNKCSKTVAMRGVIQRDPGAHEAYLKKVNKISASDNLRSQLEQIDQTKPANDFMAQVENYAVNFRCSKTKAMLAIIKTNPASHQAYIAQAQKS